MWVFKTLPSGVARQRMPLAIISRAVAGVAGDKFGEVGKIRQAAAHGDVCDGQAGGQRGDVQACVGEMGVEPSLGGGGGLGLGRFGSGAWLVFGGEEQKLVREHGGAEFADRGWVAQAGVDLLEEMRGTGAGASRALQAIVARDGAMAFAVESEPAVFPALGAGSQIVGFLRFIEENHAGPDGNRRGTREVDPTAAGRTPEKLEKVSRRTRLAPTGCEGVMAGGAHVQRQSLAGVACRR